MGVKNVVSMIAMKQ